MKISGMKAGELYEKSVKATANARSRLLELVGAKDFDFPSHRVRYCGTERHKVTGTTLTYDGNVYEIHNTLRAKPGDEKGDQGLVCYRAIKPDTRQYELLIFVAPP